MTQEMDLNNMASMLDPTLVGEAKHEIALNDLALDNISYEWIEQCNKPAYLKKALRLIEEDGRT